MDGTGDPTPERTQTTREGGRHRRLPALRRRFPAVRRGRPSPAILPTGCPSPAAASQPSFLPREKNQRVFGNTRRTYAARCLDKSNCRRQKRKSDKVTQQFIHHCCVTLPLRNPHTDEAAYPRSLLPKRAIIFSLAGPLGSGLAEHGGPGPARPWGGSGPSGPWGSGLSGPWDQGRRDPGDRG